MTAAHWYASAPVLGAAPMVLALAACPSPVPDDLRIPAQADCRVVITDGFGDNIGFLVYDDDGFLRAEERSQI